MIIIERNPKDFCIEMECLLLKYCNLISQYGVEIIPFTELTLQRFSQYPSELQSKIYFGFVKYVTAVLGILESGTSISSTTQSLWSLFKKYQMVPTSDLFSIIDEESVVEIYLPDEVQWYRSFNYFKYTSYSLGDLICIPWNELIDHDQSHIQELSRIVQGVLTNQIKVSVTPDWGPLISRERFSTRQFVARLDMKVISPLVGPSKKNEALIVVWKIEILGEKNLTLSPGLRQIEGVAVP